MRATEVLHERGQSLWLDNITRGMLESGQIQRYIDDYSVTGLTSNPSIFDKAIGVGRLRRRHRGAASAGMSGEELFFELAIEDLRRAADLFRLIHERTDGVDGWVSLEVSPLLAYDTAGTIEAAKAAPRPRPNGDNLFIKIPGTKEGLPAIEECDRIGDPDQRHPPVLGASSTWRRPRRTCGASSAGWRRASTPRSARWRRCSCPAGTSPSPTRCRASSGDQLGARSGARTYRAYRELLAPTAFSAWPTRGCGSNGSCGRAPRPRIPMPPTPSTSTAWPRRSP